MQDGSVLDGLQKWSKQRETSVLLDGDCRSNRGGALRHRLREINTLSVRQRAGDTRLSASHELVAALRHRQSQRARLLRPRLRRLRWLWLWLLGLARRPTTLLRHVSSAPHCASVSQPDRRGMPIAC